MDTRTKKVFYDKLTFIYLEMPKFNKREEELVTLFDKWMYVLKNLTNLMERPAALQERVFQRVFRVAEIARFDRKELSAYEDSLKEYRDLYSVLSTAIHKGEAKGRAKGRAEGLKEGKLLGEEEGRKKEKIEIARNMKQLGIPLTTIREASGLTDEEIQAL